MTRKVNEILGNYYNNKLRFSAATTPKHEHVEPSPPPGIEQHFRAATGSAPQQLGIVAESNMLQDGVDPKRRKKKKAKGGSEVKVLQTTKKTKQRHQDEPEWRGNKSPAAGSRTEVEHETGADSNSHSPPSLPQRQESPGVTLSALRCPSAEARLGSVCSVSPLMYSRNATGLPSSSVPLLPRSAVPTFADLDAVDLESLLRPSRAEQRKARTSLEVLLSRRDEEPGGGPAKDVDESTSQGSDSIRSSTPSDIRRRRKHNLRAPVSVRQGLRLASEDDTSDTPDGMPNATQTRSSPALESNWATLSPSQNLLALQTFPDMPRDRPPEESHGDLRPESEDLTATAVGEGDGASPNGTPRMQSAVVARGDQFRSVIDEGTLVFYFAMRMSCDFHCAFQHTQATQRLTAREPLELHLLNSSATRVRAWRMLGQLKIPPTPGRLFQSLPCRYLTGHRNQTAKPTLNQLTNSAHSAINLLFLAGPAFLRQTMRQPSIHRSSLRRLGLQIVSRRCPLVLRRPSSRIIINHQIPPRTPHRPPPEPPRCRLLSLR